MEPIVFIEILDSRGGVEHRYRAHTPVNIGRSYRNTVILDDRFVDAEHARVEFGADGELRITDLGSANGTRLTAGDRSVTSSPIRSGDTVRLGRTTVRICSVDHAVPPAAAEAVGVERVIALAGRPRWSWTVVGLCALAFGVREAVTTAETGPAAVGFGVGIAVVLTALAWAIGWSVASRVRTRRFRLHQHAALGAAAGLLLGVGTLVGAYGRFVTGRAAVWSWGEGVFGIAVLVVLLAGHLAAVGVHTARRRWIGAGGTTALVVALVYGANALGDEPFRSGVTITADLKPVSARWLATTSLETFLDHVATIRPIIDEQAASSP